MIKINFTIQAACGCNTGKIRKNNEDNFYFCGKYLEENNCGLKRPMWIEDTLKSGFTVAVFDGMGGENFGETASYAAAQQMQLHKRSLPNLFEPEETYFAQLAQLLNEAVVKEKQLKCTENMGTTMVCLHFAKDSVYICNMGDSRAYRLREGELIQLSQDHLEKRPGTDERKAEINRYLGIDPEEMEVEPFVLKSEYEKGDTYLLCSDGLSDMLSNIEINDIMLCSESAQDCAQKLIDEAIKHGGRDNITVIICKIL